ncbi:MAG TPA: ribosomal-processing cysteine protease Prp [Leptospiraceae bacterium]|nr:ribosomal-processing cysteine protease Prp [Leptospirales bacterium]HMU83752.1 ribosomal-processing cysteine protease Prp [Leptospiraceae bacterium]HMY44331.1 ribosomal-processing cysteine protease Prp [Leptospiraceae bacterium]HNE25295.1 ribosomal-processing cysteine protease Prp [Leptospiraceae bacterium]HNJ04822.1 ribosomal-processing cysteine protease Prp [Leptospiraceae bacterium]
MTRVTFQNQKGSLRLVADGHSKKTTALDLCSAISVLTETLEASIRLIAKQHSNLEKADGYFDLETEDSPAAQILFAATVLGLRSLEKQFPDALAVRVQGSMAGS